jgi:hypothetical protein
LKREETEQQQMTQEVVAAVKSQAAAQPDLPPGANFKLPLLQK